jgi:hypothetical protein
VVPLSGGQKAVSEMPRLLPRMPGYARNPSLFADAARDGPRAELRFDGCRAEPSRLGQRAN